MKILIASDAHQPNDRYRRALLVAGALPEEILVVRPGDPVPETFDGLLLAGGSDVDPARYGESAATPTLELRPERDALDFSLFGVASSLGAPVFGICRGLQVVNVALGGTLWQDLPSQRPRGIPHDTSGDLPVEHLVRVRGTARSPFASAVAGLEGAPVNSRHHQGVKDLAPGLSALAASPDDLAEAIERPDGAFLACVQWHPEDLVKERRQKALFEAFLAAARLRSKSASGTAAPARGPLVEVALEGALAVVKLSRPSHRNAFAGDMADMLAGTVEALADDPTVPAIVLTGAGGSFCGGFDPELLAALLAVGDEEGFGRHLHALARATRALATAPRPLLAALDGEASGAGLGIALACDFRIASAAATPETFLRTSPFFPALEAGCSFFLPSLASSAVAADLAFSNETLGAARAHELGYVDAVAEEGSAVPLALRRAARYAETPTAALAAARRSFATADRLARLDDALAREREIALALFRDGTLTALSALAARNPSSSHSSAAPAAAGGNDRPQ